MIDIHHHCLPGVDDGPRDLAEAIDLCAMSAAQGIETIVATPHVLRGRWAPKTPLELKGLLETLQGKTGDRPHLVLGSEYFFAHDVVETLEEGQTIIPLGGTRSILVEFASHAIPPLVDRALYRMQIEGWTPVIAHPERNVVFQNHPELLRALIRQGARTQVTTGSLVGDFGAAAERAATRWLTMGMVHFLATDAHNTGRRPPVVTRANERASELVGSTIAEALMTHNPAALLSGSPLPFEPEIIEERPDGFFARLRGLLGGDKR